MCRCVSYILKLTVTSSESAKQEIDFDMQNFRCGSRSAGWTWFKQGSLFSEQLFENVARRDPMKMTETGRFRSMRLHIGVQARSTLEVCLPISLQQQKIGHCCQAQRKKSTYG
jgi:hypothetical protein